MAQIVVNELSSLFLTFEFFDEANAPITPTTIDWRVDIVDDPHTPVEVIPWTSIGTSTSVNVQIAGASNSIVDQTKILEKRVVTVRMDAGLSTQAFQDKSYQIVNQPAVPS